MDVQEMEEAMNFAFSIVKIPMKSIADELVSMKPLTFEDIVRGRTVKPYPQKFDSFVSNEQMVDYLCMELKGKYQHLKPEWLHVSLVNSIPINIWAGVYYTGTDVYHIACTEPAKNIQHDMRQGATFLTCDPELYTRNELEAVVAEVKRILT